MWSLYEDKNFLKPLVFSNGKNQEDVVNEILKEKKNSKIIFLDGKCGTGKSAIALNLAKEIGKASIVVPVKALQKQYEDDYTNKKYLLKDDGEKFKIQIITGRQNHLCLYIKKNIFFESDVSCDNFLLPCKIEIKEKNIDKIKEYLEKNEKIENKNLRMKEIRRMSIAPICKYWCPVMPTDMPLDLEAEIKTYNGLKGKKFVIYNRTKGCGYYNQFNSYVDADSIIFNSSKYLIETLMNRKPETKIEIIDECDKFLDDFSNYEKINLSRLNFALGYVFPVNFDAEKEIEEMSSIIRNIFNDKRIEELIEKKEILSINGTEVFRLLKCFDDGFMQGVRADEENYCFHAEEVAEVFSHLLDETYVCFEKEDKDLVVKIVTTNLEKRLKEIIDKNEFFVMMSGTIHSPDVLQKVFGLNNFKMIDAETKMPGSVTKFRIGLEFNCKYENFKNGKATREQYLTALNKCVEKAVKPVLIHVITFSDLPSEEEAGKLSLSIMTREKLREIQKKDKVGEEVRRFKQGKIDILYSTKCDRGVDFPGNTCRSVIFTKYPYPDVNSLFWKVLRKTRPEYYMIFYMDKARREFLQRLYRALRSKDDHVFLLSPDLRVLLSNLA